MGTYDQICVRYNFCYGPVSLTDEEKWMSNYLLFQLPHLIYSVKVLRAQTACYQCCECATKFKGDW